jgi:hypothetical protein
MPKITALPSASTPLAGTELMVCVQGGVTSKVAVTDVNAGGGGGGGPHWVVPSGGYLEWITVAVATGQIKLDDSAVLTMQFDNGSTFINTNATAVQWQEAYNAGIITFAVSNGAMWNMSTTGGGSIICNDATNAWQEQGFTITFRCWSAPNAGYWGGAGVPGSLEAAVDRIAAVVSAGGATPIP